MPLPSDDLPLVYCSELDCLREPTWLLEVVLGGILLRAVACDEHRTLAVGARVECWVPHPEERPAVELAVTDRRTRQTPAALRADPVRPRAVLARLSVQDLDLELEPGSGHLQVVALQLPDGEVVAEELLRAWRPGRRVTVTIEDDL